MQGKSKIAVFIDADNSPAGKFETVVSELATFGAVTIRRAYGNWASPQMNSWTEILQDFAIQPIQQFDLTKGKNATDIALVIDAMDILYSKQVDIFCLVSSDCDFTPLVTRLLAEGKFVIGFGERKAPASFVNACSRFLYLDKEAKPAPEQTLCRAKTLKGNTRVIAMLRQAIEAVAEEDGWAQLPRIGSHISNHASFDPRNHGFKKLSDVYSEVDLFEVKKMKNKQLRVRDKRRALSST